MIPTPLGARRGRAVRDADPGPRPFDPLAANLRFGTREGGICRKWMPDRHWGADEVRRILEMILDK